jgi:hypothetical protein
MSARLPSQFSRWSAGLGLIVFLALTLSSWRCTLTSANGAPARHWRLGRWMLEQRSMIRVDEFSHTRANAPLITTEWLSEVWFAAAGNRFGWNGLAVVAAALIATTLWRLHRQLLAEGGEPVLATGLVGLAVVALAPHWLARPLLFTHLLALLFAGKLREFERGRLPAGRLFAWLVPAMVLWVNLHGAFVVGFGLLACHLVGNCQHRPRRRILLGVLAACLLASLLNPNGWKLHGHVVNFIRLPALTVYDAEFRSPNSHAPATQGFVLLGLVLVLVLTVVRPRLAATDITLLGAWGFFALHSARNIPIFTLVTLPILHEHLGQWLHERRTAGWRPVPPPLSRWLAATLGVVFLAAVLMWARRPLEATRERFPVAAVDFVQRHPGQVRGNMFNAYGWGSYLLRALPQEKVFVDSRNDFYGPEFMKEFDTVHDLQPGWEQVFEKYQVGWTILPAEHRLNSLLALQTNEWQEVHRDDVAVIYSRR